MGDPRLPLAIFSGGFGLDSAKYGSYTRALATCGFVSMSYDEVHSWCSEASCRCVLIGVHCCHLSMRFSHFLPLGYAVHTTSFVCASPRKPPLAESLAAGRH